MVANHDEVDHRRFRQAADRGRSLLLGGDARGARRHLAVAIGEWRGGALGEFAYEPFAERAAEELTELRDSVTEADLGARLALGMPNVIADAETFVAEHPLRELGWLYLLVALYRDGRQTEALRRGEDLRASLADVGLELSPRLRQVIDAILTHDPVMETAEFVLGVEPSATAVDDRHLRMPRWWQPSDHFVGREAELEVMRTIWHRCRSGEPHAVIISGEPGIGKSALAVEVAERAMAGGATVLAGRCSPNSVLSFEPLAEAVARLVDALDDAEIAELGDDAKRLSRLAPAMERRLGRWDQLPANGQDIDRFLLFEAVSNLLARQSEAAPIALVIDDVQWADAETLHLIDHLLRADQTGALMILLTLRSEDIDRAPRLRGFLDSWYRDGQATVVELAGFDLDEIAELLAAFPELAELVADKPGNAVARDLLEVTAGNPYFVVEMARNMDVPSVDATAVPASVQALVRSRLDRLGPTNRTVLQLGALQSDRFDIDLCSTVHGNATEVEQAIDAAVGAGLLIERNGAVLFQHDLVRQVLEAESGPAQRARWHRSLARAQLDRSGEDPSTAISRVAYHFVQAATDGNAREAVDYSKRAGDAAIRALAYETAAGHYSAGIAVAEGAQHADPGELVELRLSLLEARRYLGDYAHVVEGVEPLFDTFAQLADLDQIRRLTRVVAHCAHAVPHRLAAAFDRGMALLEEQIRADVDADDQDLAYVRLTRSLLELADGRVESSLAIFDSLLEARTPTWHPELLGMVADASLFVLAERRPIEQRVSLIAELTDAIEGDPATTLEVQQLIAPAERWAALTMGDIQRALEIDERMEARSLRLGMPRFLAGTAQRRASLALVRGDLESAERHAELAIHHRPDDEFREGYLAQLALVRLDQGRLGELLGAILQASATADPAWQVGRAWMLAESGETDAAEAALRDFIDRLDEWSRDISWLGTLGLAVHAVDALRARFAVEPLVDALEPHSNRVAIAGLSALILGPVDLLLGMLHATAGRVDDTARHLQAADPILRALRADTLIARRELVHAEALAAAGDPQTAEARAHAREARKIVDRLGLAGTLRDRTLRLTG